MRQWYVIRSKPRREALVSLRLKRTGIETYLPQARTPCRGLLAVMQPLFPSYVFARLDTTSDDYVRARSLPGVSYVLGCDGIPSPVPDMVVDAIRIREQNMLSRESRSPFQPGENVTVTSGPFKDLDAVFEGRLSANGRVRVLIRLLQRWCRVQVDVTALRRC